MINNKNPKRFRKAKDDNDDQEREEEQQQRIDVYTKNLIKLCKSTPEGFLLQIDQNHDLGT